MWVSFTAGSFTFVFIQYASTNCLLHLHSPLSLRRYLHTWYPHYQSFYGGVLCTLSAWGGMWDCSPCNKHCLCSRYKPLGFWFDTGLHSPSDSCHHAIVCALFQPEALISHWSPPFFETGPTDSGRCRVASELLQTSVAAPSSGGGVTLTHSSANYGAFILGCAAESHFVKTGSFRLYRCNII